MDSETLCEANQSEHLSDVDGILVPADLVNAVWKGKSVPSDSRVKIKCLFLGSVLGCSGSD